VERLYRDETVVKLEREATEATREVSSTPTATDAVELPRSSASLHFALYARTGRRLAGRGPTRADHVVRQALRGSVLAVRSEKSLAVAVPVSRDENVIAAVRVSAPSGVVTDRTRRAWLVMAAIGAAALAVAAGIGVWLSRRLTAPVEILARDARRLGDGDFVTPPSRSGVAELDEVANALEATGSRLGHALERERAFSADASHQLRTPLAALRVRLEAATLDPRADADSAIRAALPEVDRLEHTIDELLALARGTPDDVAPLVLRRILDDVEHEWSARLAANGRRLSVRVDADLPAVRASRSATRQILQVLLDNATSHGAGAVEVRARRAGRGVALEVADEGDGVGAAGDAIFTRRGRDDSGTGIGLALARSLAEAGGARLVLERPGPHPVFALVMASDPG
jgi:signal transduction histidine kinase